MFCQDIMRRPVECAPTGESIQSVARRMRDRNIGFIPVIDARGVAVGVITDRDLAVRACAAGAIPAQTRVEEVMTTTIIACSPHDDIDEVMRLMGEHRTSRIVVLGRRGEPVGVVSLSDLAASETTEAADTLRAISVREVVALTGETYSSRGGH